MFHFESFPKTNYKLLGNQNIDVVDITKRFRLTEETLTSSYVLYNYLVKDGERADMIAHKYYSDASLDWIIWSINLVFDPYFDWPLSSREFETYIKSSFGLEYANQTIKYYYEIIQNKTRKSDGTFIPEKKIVVDLARYNSLAATDRSSETVYEYELRKNEDRRSIKLVDKSYIPSILKEVSGLYG